MDTQLQLAEIETFLTQESQRRIIDKVNELSIFDCLTEAINSSLGTLELYYPDEIRRRDCDLLSKHSKQFQTVMPLLVEDFSVRDESNGQIENQIQDIYDSVISDCRMERNLHRYTSLCLYASATYINTTMYVVCRNEFGRFRWSFFPPLFTYEGQPESCLEYITMAMTSEKKFYKVESDYNFARMPNATGVVGMYLEALEDSSPLDIEVPDVLLALTSNQKSAVCYNISPKVFCQSCELFLEQHLIEQDKYDSFTTDTDEREGFCRFVRSSGDAFKIVCQILIYRRENDALTMYVKDWNSFVTSCKFLRMFKSLAALDSAICRRNRCVSEFAKSCQLGGQELDERRSTVSSTVIVSSSIGIASTGMVIAGLLFAPLTFGASVGVSIAGGVVGVGTGVLAGGATMYEANKQITKINDIQAEHANIQEKEQDVINALKDTQLLFSRHIPNTENAVESEIIGNILRVAALVLKASSIVGIVGSKLVKGAAGVARCSTEAAKGSAAIPILGPLSIALDILVLAQAANSKINGDRTDAGEMLQMLADTIQTKSKVLNSLLRGNLEESSQNKNLHQ